VSWQDHVYTRLCQAPGKGWVALGELFSEVEQDIPLHFAMRCAVRLARRDLPTTGIHAQWLYFKAMLHRMNLERRGSSKRWTYADQVRVRSIPKRACPNCGHRVVWATWCGRTKVVCLACEAAKTTPRAPEQAPSPAFEVIKGGCTKARSWWFRATVRQVKRAAGIEAEGERAPPNGVGLGCPRW